MSDATALTPTLEDYLEAISRLVARKGDAHAKDIAEAVSVHISTVTTALRSLSEKGLIHYSPYKAAKLTRDGQKVADRIVDRHEAIRTFLTEILLVSGDVAEENACRMEHVLDKEVMEHLTFFARFVRQCPRAGDEWLDRFRYYLGHGGQPPRDARTLQEWLQGLQQTIDEQKGGRDVMTLDRLKVGQKAKIVKVGGAGSLRRRIVDMGVVKGAPIEVVKVAPLGDPLEVKIKRYNLSLRKSEAAGIQVEPE